MGEAGGGGGERAVGLEEKRGGLYFFYFFYSPVSRFWGSPLRLLQPRVLQKAIAEPSLQGAPGEKRGPLSDETQVAVQSFE